MNFGPFFGMHARKPREGCSNLSSHSGKPLRIILSCKAATASTSKPKFVNIATRKKRLLHENGEGFFDGAIKSHTQSSLPSGRQTPYVKTTRAIPLEFHSNLLCTVATCVPVSFATACTPLELRLSQSLFRISYSGYQVPASASHC